MKETATVKDLIDHLKNNFKPTDLVCFWDEGGAWMECVHMPKSFIGEQAFISVNTKKKQDAENDTYSNIEEVYGNVKDGVILY